MTIARVEQLIALACSTEHLEEARTAALTAVRLIRKNGFRVTDGRPESRPNEPANPFGGDPFQWWYGQERADPPRGPKRPSQPEPPPEPQRARAPSRGEWVRAERSLRCTECGARIQAGERCYRVPVASDAGFESWCGRH